MITVQRNGDRIAITVPIRLLFMLRVALGPCLCKHVKSNRTGMIRQFAVNVIAHAMRLEDGARDHIHTKQIEGEDA